MALGPILGKTGSVLKATDELVAGTKFIDPTIVRYTQDSAGEFFSDGRSVLELAESLKIGTADAGSIPPIRIFEEDGLLWSLDNRRLAAFELAGKDIPYVWAQAEDVAKETWKKTTKNNGISILIRGIRIIVGGG